MLVPNSRVQFAKSGLVVPGDQLNIFNKSKGREGSE